jgi:hypothetical protein
MSEWITAREAAEILGVHMSNIPKLARRGELTRRATRPVILRADVEALRDRRAEAKSGVGATTPQPPDDDHHWLDSDAAATMMGVGRVAVNARARRGRLPSEKHDGRRWFRRDHLELVKRADEVKKSVGPRMGPPPVGL